MTTRLRVFLIGLLAALVAAAADYIANASGTIPNEAGLSLLAAIAAPLLYEVAKALRAEIVEDEDAE